MAGDCATCSLLHRQFLEATKTLMAAESAVKRAKQQHREQILDSALNEAQAASELRAIVGKKIQAHKCAAHPQVALAKTTPFSKKLDAELSCAQAEYLKIQREATDIIKDATAGMPLPDGKLRIIQAGNEARLAFEKYREALRRYKDFADYGVLHEDWNTDGR